MSLTWVKKTFWHPVFRLKSKFNNWYTQKYVIPSYSEKRKIIKDFRDQYATTVFVETGTFLGDTVAAMQNEFSKVYSIELSEELAAKAQQRFNDKSNIKILQGNSGTLMSTLLKEINAPCLFWLDGHYSSEFAIGDSYIKTAFGGKNTPVLDELKAIFTSPFSDQHVILIDDARLFTGKFDYPTMSELRSFVSGFRPGAVTDVKRDIIRIIPKP